MKTNYRFLTVVIFALSLVKSVSVAEQMSPVTVNLWPDRTGKSTEQELPVTPNKVHRVTDINIPSMTVYRADRADKQAAPAVMVCPGGGYKILAIDLEGTEMAQWLNSIGFTAIVLKYTVPDNRDAALQDAQRAMGLIRLHSKEWNINPDRLGVMGFSAGGHLSARLSTTYATRSYPPVDEADRLSCRPDFTILGYPAYLGDDSYSLAKDIAVTTNTPPAFIVQTQDDKFIDNSITYYLALKKLNIPAELHLFPVGHHGYGLRPSEYPVSCWSELCTKWLLNIASNKPPVAADKP